MTGRCQQQAEENRPDPWSKQYFKNRCWREREFLWRLVADSAHGGPMNTLSSHTITTSKRGSGGIKSPEQGGA